MSESEALLYDHAQDLDLEIERPLADWGGDEVFATVPRRRRPAHPKPAAPRQHRVAHVADRPAARPAPEFEPPAPAPVAAAQPAAWGADSEPAHEIAANGRKTVVITGRPFDHPRRRPVRSVDERIAHRPDRIAAWAVGLGFGLVLAAIATSPL